MLLHHKKEYQVSKEGKRLIQYRTGRVFNTKQNTLTVQGYKLECTKHVSFIEE